MNDEVGITANRRSEMSVLVRREREMAQNIGGVAGLLERAQHQIGKNPLLRLSGNFLREALIVLRTNIDFIGGGQRDRHRAHAAALSTAGSGFLPHRTVADGYAALREIFDPQGIAESLGEFLEFENLFRVGFFVNAMERSDPAFFQVLRDGFVGREHEFFDQAVRDVALAADDAEHASIVVELDDRLGKIEINRAASVAAAIQQKRQFLHPAEILDKRGIARGHLRIAFDDFVDVGVGHAFGGTNDAGEKFRLNHFSGRVHFHHNAHYQAVHFRIQRANAIG